MPVRTRLVALLLFGSGFCALIYQTTWLREFRLIFGASTAASAAVLGVFMAGLGLGGIILGRRSETKAQPLAFYAQLELLIALSAALSPLLIWGGRNLYIALGGTQAMGMSLGTIVRLILVALIMGTPTFLMGGTLPAAARAVVAPDDTTRRSIGVLYGMNTLGAVTGAVAGTFYCFENFGNRVTLWLAAVLNLVIALTALYFARSMPDTEVESKLPRESDKAEFRPPTSTAFVFSAAGLVGFAFFLMELVWYRMLGPLLGGSTFSFGLILAVALLGIGLGGAAYALLGLKRSASLEFFAVTCAVEAFFIALPYALGDKIAMAAMLMRPLGTLGFYGHIIAWTALSLIVIFPPAFISGVQFPLLIALLGKGRKYVGSQTGAAYAWNTTGALIGSLAGGFGFIPMFSAPAVWKMVILLLSALAFVAACLASRQRSRRLRLIPSFAMTALALLMLRATGPTAFWRHSQIGVGHVTQFQGSPNDMRDLVQRMRRQTFWETDGIESSVALTRGDELAFVLNGRIDGSAKWDAGTQVMSGLIGAALHPTAKTAMVVGLGTGSTAGWLAAVPSIQRVDVVELESAILKVAEACAPVNHNALLNPKLHVTIGDAREVLLTTREKYDIIVSEPSNPHRAGVAGLFTRECYQSIDRCLQPGGMFLQWVQAYDVDNRTMRIFYRTLGSVFSNIESWQTTAGDLLLLASHEPVRYHVDTLRGRLTEEPFMTASLAAWRANGLEDFLAHYVGNEAIARTLVDLGLPPLNTDDRTVIEFGLARNVHTANGFRIGNLRASAHAARVDRPQFVDGEIDWARVDEARLAMYAALDRPEAILEVLTTVERSRAAALQNYMGGNLAAALSYWRQQPEEPKTLSELALVAECLAAQGDSAALPYVERLAEILPWNAEAIRSAFFLADKRGAEATESLAKLFRALRVNPWPPNDLIKRSILRATTVANLDQSKWAGHYLYDSLRVPLCVFNNEADRLGAVLDIGLFLDGDHPGEYTFPAVEAFEPHIVWQQKFLQVRKDSYAAMQSPRAKQADRDFNEFMKYEGSPADMPALTKAIEAHSPGKSPNPSSSRSQRTDFRD